MRTDQKGENRSRHKWQNSRKSTQPPNIPIIAACTLSSFGINYGQENVQWPTQPIPLILASSFSCVLKHPSTKQDSDPRHPLTPFNKRRWPPWSTVSLSHQFKTPLNTPSATPYHDKVVTLAAWNFNCDLFTQKHPWHPLFKTLRHPHPIQHKNKRRWSPWQLEASTVSLPPPPPRLWSAVSPPAHIYDHHSHNPQKLNLIIEIFKR